MVKYIKARALLGVANCDARLRASFLEENSSRVERARV
jgi:hypothetical protein